MNNRKLKDNLRKRSVLVVKPRDLFMEWVEEVAKHDPLKRSVDKIYNAQGSSWLVKNPSTFPSFEGFEDYIRNKKSELIRVEANSVYPGRGLFPKVFSPESFDEYFEIEVFDELPLIEELEEDL